MRSAPPSGGRREGNQSSTRRRPTPPAFTEGTTMLMGWTDFEQTLRTFDRWQRRVERDVFADWGRRARVAWPPTNVFETKEAFVVKADVPGLAQQDVSVTVEDDVLVLRGERKVDAPAGYRAHVHERAAIAFTRRLPLTARVDANAVTATLEHGVLTVTLPKAKDALPRQIAVKAT
jgi:HSP20 family protein